MKKAYRLAITSGDIDGIGAEVTAKSLAKIRPQKGIQFYLWRSHHFPKRYLRLIDRYYNRVRVHSWPQALKADSDYYKTIIDIESPLPPPKWVEQMGKAGASKSIDALVTAPLSKTGVIAAGMKDSGHTGILKRVTKTPEVFMTFLGKDFNVVLLTGHTSIKKAYDQINVDKLETCINLTHKFKPILPARWAQKPIALVGCNPHAGEEGLIDKKEMDVYGPAMKLFSRRKVNLAGPLVPDVCFQEKYWKNYSFYICIGSSNVKHASIFFDKGEKKTPG
ncbi:MAG: 4-hydroxythreonine-4-phosphate dehydrogenase PdxA [Bdellovibrionales bacterium]|nr:4-hydroxythreonine-4-phosphate dehydrogenase PdxA [Bdellovibrionales bacterium]NQZ20313.1 4-hydroxythreonine-4-phosphate dehydrogenase PdxA [Bdellovibrionales bacterium]